MAGNKNLQNAIKAKKNEFYTQLTDIEKEMKHYRHYFKDKVVFLNCDDPKYSHFWKYFQNNFMFLGLKKLVATHFDYDAPTYKLEIIRNEDIKNQMVMPDIIQTPLQSNGDFRSPECIDILKEADIIVTNPPFSLFREFVAQLMEHNKQFIILGNVNAITYKEIFPLIQENKMWMGQSIHSGDREFQVPDDYPLTASGFRVDEHGNKFIRVKGVRWFTNLDYEERHEDIIPYKTYSSDEYPKYDNYDAIEVAKTAEIPGDYYDAMGVPITFLDKYNPDQFDILGITKTWYGGASKIYPTQIQVSPTGKKSYVKKLNDGATLKLDAPPKNTTYYIVDGEYYIQLYARILIQRKGQ